MYRFALFSLFVITTVAWGGLITEEVVGGILDALGVRILLTAAGVAPTLAVAMLLAAQLGRALMNHTAEMRQATADQTQTMARGFDIGTRSDRTSRAAADGFGRGTGPFRAVGNGRAS